MGRRRQCAMRVSDDDGLYLIEFSDGSAQEVRFGPLPRRECLVSLSARATIWGVEDEQPSTRNRVLVDDHGHPRRFSRVVNPHPQPDPRNLHRQVEDRHSVDRSNREHLRR